MKFNYEQEDIYMSQLHQIAEAERLLLSTDGSEFSEGTAREALNLAKICSSRPFAISVIETNPEFEVLAPRLIEKEEEKTRNLLEQVKSMTDSEKNKLPGLGKVMGTFDGLTHLVLKK